MALLLVLRLADLEQQIYLLVFALHITTSIPCFYFTGQVGQLHLKKNRGVRQLGFQETDVIKVFKPITKYAVQINDANKIAYELEKDIIKLSEGRLDQ